MANVLKSRTEQEELLELLLEKERRFKYNKLENWFPEVGPYRAELYPKHVAFMNAGKHYMQRCFMAANQVGKTQAGGCEMAQHLTGRYKPGFDGRKFFQPVKAWGVSKTTAVTRDSIQQSLLGTLDDPGTGMIPKEDILQIVKKSGSGADVVEKISVRHISGGISTIHFKSYDMGREVFQGTSMDVIWLDEEPSDPKIYSECLTRIVATNGIIYMTYTPLFGLSEVVLSFLKNGELPKGGIGESIPGKFVVNCTWEDVPHLDEKAKAQILASYSPHEREARSKGIPSLGAGSIYPYLEDTFVIAPFAIPANWPKAYGLDVGWNVTAATFIAKDPNTQKIYVYDEHYLSETKPIIHADSIKSRGDYLPGFIDPASRQGSQKDGEKLFDIYSEHGLRLNIANNAVEGGIAIVNQYLAAGLIKVFSTCSKFLEEFRLYHRTEDGKVVKKFDHLMDSWRYVMVSGLDGGISESEYYRDLEEEHGFYQNSQKDLITGY